MAVNGEDTLYGGVKVVYVPGLSGAKGDKGDTGDPGIQGPQGPQGIKGDKGDTGNAAPETIIVANNIDSVRTVSTNIASVNTVATNATSVASVATNVANVNTVATHVASVNSVASNISNVNAVGGDITNINAVAGDLTNIDAASGYAAQAKQWAIGSPTEPVDFSSRWWAQHHGLVGKGAYNAATTYFKNEWVTYSNGGVYSAYVSIIDNNTGGSLADPTKWMLMYQVVGSQALACREVVWTVGSTIIENTIISLPGSIQYTVGSKDLLLHMDGLMLYRGYHFREIGTVGTKSSQIQLLCQVPLGSEMSAWAVLSSDAAVGVCNESIWTTTSAITSGTTITIPGAFTYTNGANQLMVSVDGVNFFKGRNYAESGLFGSSSNQITLLCDVPVGSEIMCWSLITGSGGGGGGTVEPRVTALEVDMADLKTKVVYNTSTP